MADVPQAYVYDALRTPRGKGKKDGSLHEVKPVDLVVTLLDELRKRHDSFDPERVVALRARTNAIAAHLTQFLKNTDRYGKTIFRHDKRVCEGCNAEAWDGQDEPLIASDAENILDPRTAYQITHILEGVVESGEVPVAARMAITSRSCGRLRIR